ncbi:MAG TPA: hypothetical protein VHD56_05575 [Tepidisphaeraceae bacterium]|nr:hypothetical protein [Tepidisphaeraceae bacterium]
MSGSLRDYPDWKAPSEDGQVVIWPHPGQILRDTLSNQKRLGTSDSIVIQNIPLPRVRRRMRQFIGQDSDQPILAMGHQTELFHAGVWAKNALLHAAAGKVEGQAFHIAVDSDAPKHLELRWPGQAVPISDDPHLTTASWSAQLSPPSPAHIDQIFSMLKDWPWDFKPVVGEVLASLRKSALERDVTLAAALANALHELDWGLGLRQHVLLASPIWGCEAFLLFVHDLVARPDAIAAHYNTALEQYRKAHGIASNMRPMPDLFASDESVEIPFWLDDLHGGKRIRPTVFRTDNGWMLKLPGGEEFTFEKEIDGWEAANRLNRWLVSTQHRIAPRALTLTMFLRLLMVDQFVHGIGGGRYDQVTDQLIHLHYDIEAPAFAVTTGTMYFPPAVGQQRLCIPCVKQEGHRLRHGALGQRKRELVAQIASLPRRSKDRSRRFYQMHAELNDVISQTGVMVSWQQKVLDTEQKLREEQTLFDRELFYGMQSKERLLGMIRRYVAEFE